MDEHHVANYTVLDVIGHGSFATVYLAVEEVQNIASYFFVEDWENRSSQSNQFAKAKSKAYRELELRDRHNEGSETSKRC
jgi:serine/threonine protein kinase